MHTQKPLTALQVVFQKGDYVLYRDPALFWAGKPDHTFICRITQPWVNDTYHLLSLDGRTIHAAQAAYMRLLPPVDAMRDIDTAPLNTAGAADEMTAAAMAWLTQQHQTANRRPELPASD
ncbi:hypothetical protein [Streptomyces sp. NPDC002287]